MEKTNSILIMLVIFLLISVLFVYAYIHRAEIPIEITVKQPEVKAPFNHVKEEQIKVYSDRVELLVDEPKWARFAGTKSMIPVLDEDTNAIQIVPDSPDDIHVGDIAVYNSNYIEQPVIHRVIEISNDENGWYAILKGDSNLMPDPGRIRFGQVTRLTIGILY
jgi:hypothetical protein